MSDTPIAGPPTSQRLGWWWCAAAAVLFGATTPAVKLLVDDVRPVTLAGLLYLGAAAAVAPWAWRTPRVVRDRGQTTRLALAVAVGGGVAPVLLMSALDRTPAGTVSLMLNLEVVATTVIAWAFLREHVGRDVVFGLVLVVAGGVILTGADDAGVAAGALLVAGACVCWGIDNAISASVDTYTPAQVTLAKGSVAGSVNLVIGLVIWGAPAWSTALPALAIGALGYGASITCWVTGARLIGAARGQAVFALAPFLGVLLAWPVNAEQPGGAMFVAFALSLAGIAWIGRSRHGHLHRHDPLEHSHPVDPADPHHADGSTTALGNGQHRHQSLEHHHAHLPDVHHRHGH